MSHQEGFQPRKQWSILILMILTSLSFENLLILAAKNHQPDDDFGFLNDLG